MLIAGAATAPARAQPAAPATAGSAPAPADVRTLERVIVTGSQIPRVDAETALQVQIIRRDEIERSGASTVPELMSRISANFNGATDSVAGGNSPGFAGASLRGFGSRSTLILLNGRRVANHAFSDNDGIGVDLNVIPLAAVERVEVLKDGASAVYGSDAIAGVINFILKQDFRGVQVSAEGSRTQHGGGGRAQQTLTLGAGDPDSDGFNAFTVVDHRSEHALSAAARPFSKSAYQPDVGLDRTSPSSFPANIPLPGGNFANPAAGACPTQTVPKAGGCFYDYAPATDLLPPSDNLSLLSRATLRLPDAGRLYAEVLWSRQQTIFRAAPTPVNVFGLAGNQPIVIPESSPFYPTGLGLSGDLVGIFYRAIPLGPRIEHVASQHLRTLIGWQGTLVGWDFDAGLMQSSSRASLDFTSGYIDTIKLTDAFATGLINPFGDSGTAGDALLASTVLRGRARDSRGTTRSADFRASRDIARWEAGAVTLGVGGEVRGESLSDRTSSLNDEAVGNLNRATPKDGSRSAQALYAELALPLPRNVDAQLAVRSDHYSDFGTSTNPKIGLRWRALPTLLFRGSAGAGFRAPSLPELNAVQSRDLVPLNASDPRRCPVTQLDADCFPEVPVVSGGNPALQPERSRQLSFGLVFEPAAGASVGIDWWRLTLQHTIGTLFDELILDGDDRYEGKNIVRGPVDPAFPGLPGPIIRLIEINENLGRQSASGIDVDLRYRTPATPYGRLGLTLEGSYLASWRTSFDGISDASLPGTSIDNASYPRWQHTLTLAWDRAPWTATLVQTWRAGYTEDNETPLVSGPHRVAPYRVWDAQLAYASRSNLTLTLGVKNLLDTTPPFSNQLATQIGYDSSYADPRGRLWYARMALRW